MLQHDPGTHRQLQLRTRFQVRSKHPAASRIGERARQRCDYARGCTLALLRLHAEQVELAREGGLNLLEPPRAPVLEPLLGHALQMAVHDRADVRGRLAGPDELRSHLALAVVGR